MGEESNEDRAEMTSRRQLLGKAGVATLAAAGGVALAADPASAQTSQLALLPFGPERVYDTRVAEGRILANQQRTLLGAAAPDEIAHLYNVTITETLGAGGFVAVFPGDIAWPGTSTINWFGPGQMLANSAYTFLADPGGTIRVRAGGPPGSSTHVVLDLVGILKFYDLAATSQAVRGLAAVTEGETRQLRSLEG